MELLQVVGAPKFFCQVGGGSRHWWRKMWGGGGQNSKHFSENGKWMIFAILYPTGKGRVMASNWGETPYLRATTADRLTLYTSKVIALYLYSG